MFSVIPAFLSRFLCDHLVQLMSPADFEMVRVWAYMPRPSQKGAISSLRRMLVVSSW